MQEKKEMCIIVDPKQQKEVVPKKTQMCLKVMAKATGSTILEPDEVVRYCQGLWANTAMQKVSEEVKNVAVEQREGNSIKGIPCVVPKSIVGTGLVENMPCDFNYQDNDFNTSIDGRVIYKGNELMNCVVKIDKTFYSENKVKYECSVYIHGRIVKAVVLAKDFTNIFWLQNRIPGFATNGEKGIATQLVYKYLNALIRTSGMKNIVQMNRKPGWTNHNGRMIYITPEGSIPFDMQMITSEYGQRFGGLQETKKTTATEIIKMTNITPNSWTAPVLLLYTVMSFSHELYRSAGFTPKFLIFMHGKRGSYKTSLALIMTQIERTDTPEYSLKSTSAGIETGYKKYKDAVMLVDDLAPVQSAVERKRLQSNLDVVTRAFGDGNGIVRNNDYQKPEKNIEQYEAEGGAVITGEYVTGCESSLSRSLFLPLSTEDVDVNMLSELQEKKGMLASFLIGYISFLSGNYHEMVNYIKERGKRLREQFVGKYSNERYGEYFAQLMVAAELLVMQYGYKTSQFTLWEAEKYLRYFEASVSQAIECNSQELSQESPITNLCRAILTKIQEKMYLVIEKERYWGEDGYVLESEESYFIQQKDILAMKKAYDSDNGYNKMEYSSTNLAKMLCDADIAPIVQEGKTKRYGRKIGKLRFMELDKRKLHKIADM